MRAALFAAVVCSGCGLLDDDGQGPPPPIGESNSAGMTQGVAGGTAGNSSGGASTGASTSDGADTTAGVLDLGMGILMVGEIDVGDGAWAPPLPCSLRFFTEEQLDPRTGVAMEWIAEIPIEIDEFPFAFSVSRDDVPPEIDVGSELYFGVRCDFDGDGALDNVGAFFPELPAELIVLPADGVNVALQFL